MVPSAHERKWNWVTVRVSPVWVFRDRGTAQGSRRTTRAPTPGAPQIYGTAQIPPPASSDVQAGTRSQKALRA